MSDLGSQMWGMVNEYRFAVHTPEQLWAMVESADGTTPADLGALLTSAAKTITSIGDDLKTHSTAVEWDGEGGDAFRKWVHQAALATLGLGDYSETAGKWMANAADTLHEVKPQLESLKNSSVAARSVLDAHAAKAADVGNHDGGPSESAVTSAKSQYDNDRAEAAMLMMKLAQSYTASNEQIGALKEPEFPELPKQFVPDKRDGRDDKSGSSSEAPSNTEAAAVASGAGVAAAGTAVVREAARGAALATGGHGPTASPPKSIPDLPMGGTGTSLDRASTLPSSPASAAPLSPPSPSPSGIVPPGPGTPPPVFGGTGRPAAPPRASGAGRLPSAYGARGPFGTPTAPGTPGTPGASRGMTPGRGVPGMPGSGTPSGSAAPRRGPGNVNPGRPSNGIVGGRPMAPEAGRPASAPSRGTVIGGTPAQPTPGARGGPVNGARTGAVPGPGAGSAAGRGSGSTGARLPAHSDGVAGGQPQPSKTRRSPSPAARGTGLVRSTEGDVAQAQRGSGPARASSTTSRKDGARPAPSEHPRSERPVGEEAEAEQTTRPLSPPRLPGLPDE